MFIQQQVLPNSPTSSDHFCVFCKMGSHSCEHNGEAISLSQTERGRLSEPHHLPMKFISSIPPLSVCRFPLLFYSMLLLCVILECWRSCHVLAKIYQRKLKGSVLFQHSAACGCMTIMCKCYCEALEMAIIMGDPVQTDRFCEATASLKRRRLVIMGGIKRLKIWSWLHLE